MIRRAQHRHDKQFISAILDAALELFVLVLDPAGRVVQASASAQQFTGYAQEELQGRYLWDVLLSPEERDDLKGAFAHVKGGAPISVEHDCIAKDGRHSRMNCRFAAVRHRHGAVQYVITTCVDTTARYTSEATVRALLEAAAQGIIACGADGKIVLCNSTAEKMFGYPREELIGRTMEVLLPANVERQHTQHREAWFARPLNRPMGLGLDLAGRRKEGSEFPLEISLSHIQTPNGVLGVAFISDITQRKAAEVALRESEERLRAFVTASSDMIYRMSLDWKEVHHLSGRRFLRDPDSSCSGWLQAHIPVHEQPRVSAAIEEAIRTKSAFELEYQVVKQDGSLGWTQSRAVPILDARGEIVEWFGAATDISRRKDVEIALGVSQESLRDLTARLLETRESDNRALARELHDVYSQELASLTMEISSIAHSKHGKPLADLLSGVGGKLRQLASSMNDASRQLHPKILEELGLEAALRDTCERFSASAGVRVEFHTADVTRPVREATALCLYRVSQEALRNIARHAWATAVYVQLAGEERGVRLRIVDDGQGFEVNQVRRKGRLGLVSMEERVRLVGGTLTVDSEPGNGTRVEVFVPKETPNATV